MRPVQQGLAALAVLALLGLAGCNGSPRTETLLLIRQAAIDPPQLWRVETIGDTGAIQAAVYVCADTALREAFARTRAEVNGKTCRDTTSPLIRPNGWVLRCETEGRPFGISAATVGDLQQDFRLQFALTELFYFPTGHHPAPLTVRQNLHFLRLGACPAGWRIGDQARPGRRPGRT